MRTGILAFAFTLYLGSLPALGSPLGNTYTHHAALTAPELSVSSASFNLAATWFLPDWQAGGDVAEKIYKNPHRLSDDSGSGDRQDTDCTTYGFSDSCSAPFIHDGKISPAPRLTCYKNCRCPATVIPGEGERCISKCNDNCIEKACNTAVDWWDEYTENCTLKCASDPSICVKAECKSRVYPGVGEACWDYCWKIHTSDPDYCTEKRCKKAVTVDTGEQCSEHCVSNLEICTAKVCKTTVSVNTGEYCTERCAADNSCTAKACKKEVSPGRGEECTEYCNSNPKICTAKKDSACPSGYSTTITSTKCIMGDANFKWTFESNGYSGSSLCGKCTQGCYEGFQYNKYSCANTTTEDKGWTYEQKGKINGVPCGRCIAKSCPDGESKFKDRACLGKKELDYWIAEKDLYNYTGDENCYICNPLECPAGSSTSKSCSNGYTAKLNGSYSGDSPCYSCVKSITCEDGGYKSKMPEGQTCSTITYQGLTCYNNCRSCSCYLTSKPMMLSVYTDPEPNCSKFYCVNSCGTDTAMKSNGYIYDCCPRYTTMSRPGNNVCIGKFVIYKATISGKGCCGYMCSSVYAPTPSSCSTWSGGGSWDGGWEPIT